jgi:hypothetical protein
MAAFWLEEGAMAKPDILIVDGHAFSWQRLVELRRAQLETWRAEQCHQPTLFELKDDCRPTAERTPGGRYREPTFLALIAESQGGRTDEQSATAVST